ncbi:hypothetical protein [Sphingomonas sp.]|uniref:hypothetical protein n=1 Tax=Sphingomonas sp. TaxID=28214 RepID=UPI000DB0BE9B|nr:hypothetical protein [Sphingomonas sp.]PZU07010.1 MAG: hypothetical protein DI605_16785 [Sphingomonas sp.]
MRRPAILTTMMLAPCLIAASGPQSIGQFGRWGAFRAADGASCYAIAQPSRSGREDGAYLTISSWPARRLVRQIHVRFRGVPADGAVLSIGERRFPLATNSADGWPASPADGRRIARLVREGGTLRITARIGGRRISDTYALAGAPSAIDAADLACLRER